MHEFKSSTYQTSIFRHDAREPSSFVVAVGRSTKFDFPLAFAPTITVTGSMYSVASPKLFQSSTFNHVIMAPGFCVC